MTTIEILGIAGVGCLLFYLIRRIGRTRLDMDNHNPKAEFEQEGGFFNATLDDSYRLANILRLTWEYFDSHPVNGEFTELHYLSADQDFIDCQIIRQRGPEGFPELKLLFVLDKPTELPACFAGQTEYPLQVIFRDPEERGKAVAIIKEVMKAKDDTKIPYQLAGSNGPECFFYKPYLDEKNPESAIPDDNVDRRLGHVLERTWFFFVKYPDSQEYTEIETESGVIQITSEISASGPKYRLFIDFKPGMEASSGFNPEYDNGVCFKGTGAARRAEMFIYETLGLTAETRVRYQLAGSSGPDDFLEEK